MSQDIGNTPNLQLAGCCVLGAGPGGRSVPCFLSGPLAGLPPLISEEPSNSWWFIGASLPSVFLRDTLRILRWPDYFVDPPSDTTSGDVIWPVGNLHLVELILSATLRKTLRLETLSDEST